MTFGYSVSKACMIPHNEEKEITNKDELTSGPKSIPLLDRVLFQTSSQNEVISHCSINFMTETNVPTTTWKGA
jgi:hypothetical protein